MIYPNQQGAMYPPTQQLSAPPMTQYGYAPQMPRQHNWWRWAGTGLLGGLGIAGILLGNKMSEDTARQIKENNRRKWIPNAEIDPTAVMSLGVSAPNVIRNIRSIYKSIKSNAGSKEYQNRNIELAKAYYDAKQNNNYGDLVSALSKYGLDIDAIKNDKKGGKLLDDDLRGKIFKTLKKGHFSNAVDDYHNRYKYMNFNYPAPYAQPYTQPYSQVYTQGFTPQVASGYQGYYPSSPARTASRIALGSSAALGLAGLAYMIKKANSRNQELADSMKESFINKLNITDFLGPTAGISGIAKNIAKDRNMAEERRADTKTQVKHILKHGVEKTTDLFGNKWKSEEEKKKEKRDIVDNILSNIGNIGQMGIPLSRKFMDYLKEQGEG